MTNIKTHLPVRWYEYEYLKKEDFHSLSIVVKLFEEVLLLTKYLKLLGPNINPNLVEETTRYPYDTYKKKTLTLSVPQTVSSSYRCSRLYILRTTQGTRIFTPEIVWCIIDKIKGKENKEKKKVIEGLLKRKSSLLDYPGIEGDTQKGKSRYI